MFLKSDIIVLITNDNFACCVYMCAHTEFVLLLPFSLDSLEPFAELFGL